MKHVVDVRITQGPTLGGALFAALVVTALFLAYWKAILSVVSILSLGVLIWFAYKAWQKTVDQQIRHNKRLAAEADQQHQWVMQGDERGTYGRLYHNGQEPWG